VTRLDALTFAFVRPGMTPATSIVGEDAVIRLWWSEEPVVVRVGDLVHSWISPEGYAYLEVVEEALDVLVPLEPPGADLGLTDLSRSRAP
jgi:hypothetical protein